MAPNANRSIKVFPNSDVLRYHGNTHHMSTRMTDDFFSPIHALVADIALCAEALSAKVDDSWNDEQRKLLEIILISAHNPARWLPAIPTDPALVNIWKHDALSPLIAITAAAELLVEDFETCGELKETAQQIFDASVKARERVIQIADESQRQKSG
jgi:hypothetical protein